MNGIVDQNCEARLRLVVSNESKQRQVIDAVIDTGFTGFLTLPLTVRSQSCRVRSLMQLLPLHWSILGNAPCSWIETVSLSLVGWVERNNTGAKIAQFAWKSATQPPQRLLFVGFPWVNPTYNNCCSIDRPFSGQNSKYKQIKYYYLLTNEYICCKKG